MKYKEIYSSFYTSVFDKRPTMVSVHDFLTDDSHRNKIERLRDTIDQDETKAIKDKLPCMTISGLCDGSHSNFRNHNSLICIDVDGKANPQITDWVEFVNSLKWMPNVWFCGLSASGQGCFLVIGIKYPVKHPEHFRSIQNWFSNDLGVTIDPQCVNKNRLRFQSYNTLETSWFNHDAKVWKYLVTNSTEPVPETPVVSEDRGDTENHVEKCIRLIEESGIDITAGENWLRIGCALVSEFGEAGRGYFHRVSKYHAKYTPYETDKKYSYWLTRGYRFTIRTFFYICSENGVKHKSTHSTGST